MQVVTVTSDWNKSDYYLPSLEGELLTLSGDIKLISVTNSIKVYNVVEGCFILKHSFFHFPKGTIHLLAVKAGLEQDINMALIKHNEHWFVAPNDGRLSLLIDNNENNEYYLLPDKYKKGTFSELNYFKDGVRRVLENRLGELKKINKLRYAAQNFPSVHGSHLQGSIQYIDSYGNAISNITKQIFIEIYLRFQQEWGYDPEFEIFVGGPSTKIETIDIAYDDVSTGETVALFNSIDLLEFAIYNGNFSVMENIDIANEVIIKFK